jgi:membrane protease YdiL (CAAX protease family)
MTATDAAGSATATTRRGFWSWSLPRLVVLFVATIVLYGGGQVLTFTAADKLTQYPKWQIIWAGTFITVIVMIVAYRALIRWTEKRTATELGSNKALTLAANGILVGLGLFCAVYAVLWLAGAVTFTGLNPALGVIPMLAISISSAIGEEIIFRGVVYRILENSFGTIVALIFSGALFGLLHTFNPGATMFSTLAIALEAGILLGAAYTLTRSLWFPIGLHFGWNFTEGGIFGAAVSGGQFKGLIDAQIAGSDLLTGGKFGPEASLTALVICLGAALVMLSLCAFRNLGTPLSFRMRG